MNNYSREELFSFGFIEVGHNVMVSRHSLFYAIRGKIGDNTRIDAFSILTGEVHIGNNVHISPFCFLSGTGGKIVLDDNSGLSSHVSIFTKSDDYRAMDLMIKNKICGDVYIGKNSIIGCGSKILPNVKIYEDVSIGMNCVISSDIEAGSIVVNKNLGIIIVGNRCKKL